MASNSESLPEGTDTIIPGASATGNDEAIAPPPHGARLEPAGAPSAGVRDKIGEKTADLRAQATDKAREYATQGKDKAVTALDNVVKLVDEAAGTIDEKVGDQYGVYARRASESISSLATTLREKDVDELFRDAREAVRKSPAIAIGVAAAAGFLIARVIKSASTPAPGAEAEGKQKAKPSAPSVPDRPAA
jgi:ElaB/YqjD/DUF883 family membrane-anchored ribosome-binding protein